MGASLTMEPRRRHGMADQREVEQAVYRLTPAGTAEVAELIGLSRQATMLRLRALDHREHIWSKKVGPTKVWMHPRIMDDPDPERDTSAEGLEARVFGDLYRLSREQAPYGDTPRKRQFCAVDLDIDPESEDLFAPSVGGRIGHKDLPGDR